MLVDDDFDYEGDDNFINKPIALMAYYIYLTLDFNFINWLINLINIFLFILSIMNDSLIKILDLLK